MAEPQSDGRAASRHLWVTCPHCQRSNLRIRREAIGRKVLCKHCGNRFRARMAHDPSAPAAPRRTTPMLPLSLLSAETDRRRIAILEGELRQVRGALAAQAADCDAVRREREELLESFACERDRLAASGEEARQEHERCLAALRHELEIARAEATARRDRAAARVDIEHRLEEVTDRLRAETEKSHRLESEAQVARDRLAELQRDIAQKRALGDGDLRAAQARIAQLGAELHEARTANERLRCLLKVFGLAEHLNAVRR
jgi:hypothetical protein